jgi:hypothetical protein
LRTRLKAAAPPDAKAVQKLIVDLDSGTYQVRQKASLELRKMGEAVLPAIDRALQGKPGLEAKKRLQDLREQMTRPLLTDESLRDQRAIEALESIGTPAARQILQDLSQGAPGVRLTAAAQAALRRLEKKG